MFRPLNILVWLLLLSAPAGATEASDCSAILAQVGAPVYKGAAPDHSFLCRSAYALSHNNERRTPDWVVERLTPEKLQGESDRKKMKDPFATDPDLDDGQGATLGDYRGSGYDRGHMAPAADMKFSDQAMRESFYLSNMAPQVGRGMNQGIWADLEKLVRDWACSRGEMVVITGPIYDAASPRMIPAKNPRVAVPDAFYKIAYSPKEKRAVSFILPNRSIGNGGARTEEILLDYLVPIREIENRSGLDFLTALSSRKQNVVELSKGIPWKRGSGCVNPKERQMASAPSRVE